jgi:ribosomal protein S18 acetylase RimI-like enzyme
MEINIRKATSQDYDGFCELVDTIDALHREQLPDMFQKPAGPSREKEYYLDLIADENVGLFLAEAGGKLAGYAHILIKEAPAIPIFVPRRYAVIDAIVVDPRYRNQGAGARLMDEMHAWAVAQGAASIELNVYEFNQNAIRFYQNLGFQTFSRKMRKKL